MFKNNLTKFWSVLTAVLFAVQTVLPSAALAQVSAPLYLPPAGAMVTPRGDLQPALMMGVIVNPEDPFAFDFLISRGDNRLPDTELEFESRRLIKYFLASLTVPESEMWVNLSPYEPDRIIPTQFGYTEMGRDMLAQDYLLKQLAASLMHPEEDSGQKFWQRVRERTQREFGLEDFPSGILSRIWIVPAKAVVYEHDNGAFVVSRELRVMTEEDYVRSPGAAVVSLEMESDGCQDNHCRMMTEIVREILIPELEHEVNYGKTFANLRQIFNSMILAAWYKQALRETLLGRIYIDRQKVKGVEYDSSVIAPGTARVVASGMPPEEEDARGEADAIYDQYLDAFQKGVFNFVKDDYDPVAQQIIPRKYFSGGVTAGTLSDGAMLVLNAEKMDAASPAMISILKEFVNGLNTQTVAKVSARAEAKEGDGFPLIQKEFFELMKLSVRRLFPSILSINEEGFLRDQDALQEAFDILGDVIGKANARDQLLKLAGLVNKGQFNGDPWKHPVAGFLMSFDQYGSDFFRRIFRGYPFLTDYEGHRQGKNLSMARDELLKLEPLSSLLSAKSGLSQHFIEQMVRRHLLLLVILQNKDPQQDEVFQSLLLRSFFVNFDKGKNAYGNFVYGLDFLKESIRSDGSEFVVAHEVGHAFSPGLGSMGEGEAVSEMMAEMSRWYLNAVVNPDYPFIGDMKEAVSRYALRSMSRTDGTRAISIFSGTYFIGLSQLLAVADALRFQFNSENLFLAARDIYKVWLTRSVPSLPTGTSAEDQNFFESMYSEVFREMEMRPNEEGVSVSLFTKRLLINYLKREGFEFSVAQENDLMRLELLETPVYLSASDGYGSLIDRNFAAKLEEEKRVRYFLGYGAIRKFLAQARKDHAMVTANGEGLSLSEIARKRNRDREEFLTRAASLSDSEKEEIYQKMLLWEFSKDKGGVGGVSFRKRRPKESLPEISVMEPRFETMYEKLGAEIRAGIDLVDIRARLNRYEPTGYLTRQSFSQAVTFLEKLVGITETRRLLLIASSHYELNSLNWPIVRFFQGFDRYGPGFFGRLLEEYDFLGDLEGHRSGRHLKAVAGALPRLPGIRKSLDDLVSGSPEAEYRLVERIILRLVYLQNLRPVRDDRFRSVLLSAMAAEFDFNEFDNAHADYSFGLRLAYSLSPGILDMVISHEIGHNVFGIGDINRMNPVVGEMVSDISAGLGLTTQEWQVYLEGLRQGSMENREGETVITRGGFHYTARSQLLAIRDVIGSQLNPVALFQAAMNLDDRFGSSRLPQSVTEEIGTNKYMNITGEYSVAEFTKALLLEYARHTGYPLGEDAYRRLMSEPLKQAVVEANVDTTKYPNLLMDRHTLYYLDPRELKRYWDMIKQRADSARGQISEMDRAMASGFRQNNTRNYLELGSVEKKFRQIIETMSYEGFDRGSNFDWDLDQWKKFTAEFLDRFEDLQTSKDQKIINNFKEALYSFLKPKQVDAFRDEYKHFDQEDLIMILQRTHFLVNHMVRFGLTSPALSYLHLDNFIGDIFVSHANILDILSFTGLLDQRNTALGSMNLGNALNQGDYPRAIEMLETGSFEDVLSYLAYIVGYFSIDLVTMNNELLNRMLGDLQRINEFYERMDEGFKREMAQKVVEDLRNEIIKILKVFGSLKSIKDFRGISFLGRGMDGIAFVLDGEEVIKLSFFEKREDRDSFFHRLQSIQSLFKDNQYFGIFKDLKSVDFPDGFAVVEFNQMVSGSSIMDLLEDGSLSLEQSLNLGTQFIQIAAALYKFGYIDDDIRNFNNVIIGTDGIGRLVDFGRVLRVNDMNPEHVGFLKRKLLCGLGQILFRFQLDEKIERIYDEQDPEAIQGVTSDIISLIRAEYKEINPEFGEELADFLITAALDQNESLESWLVWWEGFTDRIKEAEHDSVDSPDDAMVSEAADLFSSDLPILRENLRERWAQVQGAALSWQEALQNSDHVVDLGGPEGLSVDDIRTREDLKYFIEVTRLYVQYVLSELISQVGKKRSEGFVEQSRPFLDLLTRAEESVGLSVSGSSTGSAHPPAAMTADDPLSVDRKVGGIDFNPDRMDLEVRRDASGRILPASVPTLAEDSIEGFYPVIINITPVFNPLPLLGMGDPSLGNLQHAFHG